MKCASGKLAKNKRQRDLVVYHLLPCCYGGGEACLSVAMISPLCYLFAAALPLVALLRSGSLPLGSSSEDLPITVPLAARRLAGSNIESQTVRGLAFRPVGDSVKKKTQYKTGHFTNGKT